MRSKRKLQSQTGFTLIELMLAMTFFASILMVSTIVIMQVFGIYNKGISVKQINSVSRTFTDDIIRVGNSAVGKVAVGGMDNDDTHPRCLGLGSNVYIWSYDSDDSASSSVYRTGSQASPELVSFSRLKSASTCPVPTANVIPATELEPILSANVRVYGAEVKTIGDAEDLLRFKITLGTYAGTGSPNNPNYNKATGNASCTVGSLGNFCAFGTYDTVIYLPNS